MKKIGSKVLLMMVLFVVIFGLNTITSVRSQNRVKRSGLEITEQYIPIQTEIFTIQKSMERGQKYLNIISLYDNAELRQQLEGSLAEEVSTITESEKKIDVYLKDNNNTKLKDAFHQYIHQHLPLESCSLLSGSSTSWKPVHIVLNFS